MSEIGLDVGQASELKMGFRRADFTNEDVKRMCEGDMLSRLLPVVRGRARVVIESILTFVSFVKVAAQPVVVTSMEYFKEAGVSWIGGNFEAQFLGLEVPAVGEAELKLDKLEEWWPVKDLVLEEWGSVDNLVITELGGEGKAEIWVSQFRTFLKCNCENSKKFMFFLRGKDGKLWVVDAGWISVKVDHDDIRCGWDIEAHPIRHPDGRPAGRHVLSNR